MDDSVVDEILSYCGDHLNLIKILRIIHEEVDMDNNAMNEILSYCGEHIEQMWASRVVGMILGCEFRDAATFLKNYIEAARKCERLEDHCYLKGEGSNGCGTYAQNIELIKDLNVSRSALDKTNEKLRELRLQKEVDDSLFWAKVDECVRYERLLRNMLHALTPPTSPDNPWNQDWRKRIEDVLAIKGEI